MVITRAAEEGVILFTLPPHTSLITQPLDKGCFGPLKKHWRQECWGYISSNLGKVVTRYQFSKLFRAAWEKGLTMTNIIAGFRTTGIFPFARSAVDLRGYHGVPEKRMSLPQRTGLQFIPLFSPLKSTQSSPKPQAPVFESSEMEVYQRRYDDIPDQRYRQWVKMYHPESPCIESSAQLEPTPANEIEGIRLDHSSDHEISSAFHRKFYGTGEYHT